ncbi:MAG: hypothetical protein A2Y78_10110 [Acidobacteria bacterium RBG_13_68_16]|nr:MAG: hypothetical protein A2Y78_10110 [Acidobacteria bacterium RBG_13_68_16]
MSTDVDDQPMTDTEVAMALDQPLPGMPQAPTVAEPDPTDLHAPRPGAPYGVTTRGKPRKRPAKRAASSPRKRSTPSTRSTTAGPEPVDYTAGARSLVATAGMILGLAGRTTGDASLQLDALTLQVHREPLAAGLADAALHVPIVASVLAWFATTSPYAALAESIGKVGAQIAVNHGLAPAGSLGAVDAQTLQVQAARRTVEDLRSQDLPIPDELLSFAGMLS